MSWNECEFYSFRSKSIDLCVCAYFLFHSLFCYRLVHLQLITIEWWRPKMRALESSSWRYCCVSPRETFSYTVSIRQNPITADMNRLIWIAICWTNSMIWLYLHGRPQSPVIRRSYTRVFSAVGEYDCNTRSWCVIHVCCQSPGTVQGKRIAMMHAS